MLFATFGIRLIVRALSWLCKNLYQYNPSNSCMRAFYNMLILGLLALPLNANTYYISSTAMILMMDFL
jgi:hypothetical protein